MTTRASDLSQADKTAQLSESFRQLLEKTDEELKRLDEIIRKAEEKSKAVLCDPGP